MRVLRLCSVYEAPPESLTRTDGFDTIGRIHVHTARLTTGERAVTHDVVDAP